MHAHLAGQRGSDLPWGLQVRNEKNDSLWQRQRENIFLLEYGKEKMLGKITTKVGGTSSSCTGRALWWCNAGLTPLASAVNQILKLVSEGEDLVKCRQVGLTSCMTEATQILYRS